MFSFFTRNLQPLAVDVIQLLQKSLQWVDPNLLLLADEESSNKNKNQAKRPKRAKTITQKPAPSNKQSDDDDDNSFEALAGSRIVLKRSKNVSDTSDDEPDGE